MMTGVISSNSYSLPQVRKVPKDAHWKWFEDGWQAMLKSRIPSLKIGGGIVAISLLIIIGLYKSGLASLIPAACGAFALVGPLLATFIYGIGRSLDEKDSVKRLRHVSMRPKSASQVGFIGFVLGFIVLVWARLATLAYALASGTNHPMHELDFISFVLTTPEGMGMAVIGTIIGGFLAAIVFILSSISIPLAFDRDIDAVSAMMLSTKAAFLNPVPMFSWAFVIALMIGFSAFVGFLPLLVIFPWLGHVAWCAYKDLIT